MPRVAPRLGQMGRRILVQLPKFPVALGLLAEGVTSTMLVKTSPSLPKYRSGLGEG